MPLLDSPVLPKLDLVDARSQLLQAPQSPSAKSSLHDSISTSEGRKRPRYNDGNGNSSIIFQSPSSPASLVDTDYHSGSGDFYPTWLNARSAEEASAELDYRQNRYQRGEILSLHLDENIELVNSDDCVATREQKRPRRSRNTDAKQPGWGDAVIGVVGKVWNFCYSKAFRGFYAGGGQGYQLPTPELHGYMMHDDVLEKYACGNNICNRAIPGQYPDEEEMDRSWIIIPDQITQGSRTNTPSPSLRRQYAAPRPGKKAVVRSSRSPSPTKQSHSPGPKSPRRSMTQRCATQVQRTDSEEDASLRRLNSQLRAMIKEGKEALGMQIEVEDMDDSD